MDSLATDLIYTIDNLCTLATFGQMHLGNTLIYICMYESSLNRSEELCGVEAADGKEDGSEGGGGLAASVASDDKSPSSHQPVLPHKFSAPSEWSVLRHHSY